MDKEYRAEDVQAIIDCIDDPVVITDGNGTVLLNNKSEQRYVDTNDKIDRNMIGRNLREVVGHRGFDSSAVLKTLESGEPESVLQNLPDGEMVTTAIPIKRNGKIVRVVAIGHNPSRLEELQKQIRETEKKLKRYEVSEEHERSMRHTSGSLIYEDPNMVNLVNTALKVAKSDVSVLIQGESGSGKELIADLIVQNSMRKDAPFIRVNCGAIHESLIEAELFGYEKGAFTGALDKGRIGLFEAADGGTILLDEIGELPLAAQTKLLRVLQEGEIIRVGGHSAVSVDVRIIAATNANLGEKMNEGTFRSDLYYRLNIMPLDVPPLRERKGDIEALTYYFLDQYNKKYRALLALSPEVITLFKKWHWPGNVRELKNVVERLVLNVEDERQVIPLVKAWLYQEGLAGSYFEKGKSYREQMERYEKNLLEGAYAKAGSGAGVARLLDLSKASVSKKFKKYNIGTIKE